MKKYIGFKMVEAEPMTKEEWSIKDIPYVTEGYMIKYPDGYLSWSPKEIFEEAYRHCDNMTFGLAIEAMKKGYRVARKGWNGKGMFAVYQKAYPQGIPCNKQTAEAWGLNEGDLFKCEPYLQLKMANGSHTMWNPNTLDILAEDWIIIE